MKITIESTTKIVELNGIPCRIWEGETESGIKMHAFISRVAIGKDENAEEFARELQQCAAPSVAVEFIPDRLII